MSRDRLREPPILGLAILGLVCDVYQMNKGLFNGEGYDEETLFPM